MIKRISVISVALVAGFAAAACTSSEKRTAGYGVGGAALGALAGGAIGNSGRGALAGAAIGGAAGTLLGVSRSHHGTKYCNYRDPHGRIYEAPCR